jgi:hypothetical protein
MFYYINDLSHDQSIYIYNYRFYHCLYQMEDDMMDRYKVKMVFDLLKNDIDYLNTVQDRILDMS